MLAILGEMKAEFAATGEAAGERGDNVRHLAVTITQLETVIDRNDWRTRALHDITPVD